MKKIVFVTLGIVLTGTIIWYELSTAPNYSSNETSRSGNQPTPAILAPLKKGSPQKDRISVTQSALTGREKMSPIVNDLAISKKKAISEIEKKFKQNKGKVVENFLGSFKAIKIKDYPAGSNLKKFSHDLLKKNKELLWGPPTGSSFHFESLRSSSKGKLAVFSIQYKGHTYPGKKVVLFREQSTGKNYHWTGINDTSTHLKSIKDCKAITKPEVLELLKSFHKDPVQSLVSIEKVITPGPELTGQTSLEATYLLKEANIITKTYSAIIDLCAKKVSAWRPVEKT